MVFSPKSARLDIYSAIQRASISAVCSVLIFVAPTVDALCALKILVHMFRTDFIPFKIIPISGFSDLAAANEEHIQGQDDIKTVIMLGCGGIVDLSEHLSLSANLSVYVFDSSRPYNLRNIFSNAQITIVDDGFIEINKHDLEDAYFAYELDESDDEEDDEGEGEEDADEDSEAESGGDEENDENFGNPAASGASVGGPRKERATAMFKNMCRRKLDEYRRAFWSGLPLAGMLFELCDGRGCASNDLLWLAITGVTDMFLKASLNDELYRRELHVLKNAQERLNPNVVQRTKAESSAASGSSALINADGVVSFEADLRFVLLRHWTLYNSMLHSDFIASRLCAWREKGRKQLELLLARMGFPLSQCRTDYSAMDLEYRELFTIQLEKFAEEFNLQHFSFPSFTRDFGYLLKVSAADCVYALRSVLECPSAVSMSKTTSVEDVQTWRNNFFFAFDALEYKNTDLLKMGIELSIRQHHVVFKETSTILSHRLIRLSKSFRYVIIRNGVDLSWLLSPSALHRLGRFLVDATKSQKKGSELPLVVAIWNAVRDTFVVTAMEGESRHDQRTPCKRITGAMFQNAAAVINARIKMDTFNLSTMEIKSSDLKSFIKSLQSTLSTA